MTLLDVLSSRATQRQSAHAFVFLEQLERKAAISFAELADSSRALAAELRRHAELGDRAVLCYPPGLEFIRAFFACLYAGLVAVPIYPPRPRQKLARLESVLASCEASLILCDSSVSFDAVGGANAGRLQHSRIICTDQLQPTWSDSLRLPEIGDSTLAFLQYTSGSTGEPKGVMVSHGNIMANLRALCEATTCCADDVFVNWLPLFHDLGLINTILLPIYLGAQSVLMAPMDFIQRPRSWLEAITRYRGTIAGAPNFAYDLCLERIDAAERTEFDLSSWRIAFNAAEPIKARTLTDFAAFFAPCGFCEASFYPSYGLAEATVFLTGGRCDTRPAIQRYADIVASDGDVGGADRHKKLLVGCGAVQSLHALKIVDPVRRDELPEGTIGEVWACGPSIAQGYWNLAQRSRETFGLSLPGDERRWLRTGDLGCLRDGQLYVTGRIKDVVVIRGQNYYPSDIESVVQDSHAALRRDAGAAFSIDVDGVERLIVAQEVTRTALRDLDAQLVHAAILQSIAREFELDVYAIVLIKPASLRKTSSGKIQRSLCKQQYLRGELATVAVFDRSSPQASAEVAPATEIEKGIADALAEALAIQRIGVTDNFLVLGADSIRLTRAVVRIDERFGVRLPVSSLFDSPTVRELAGLVADMLSSGARTSPSTMSIDRADRASLVPVSLAQERLWFLASLQGPSPAYNEFRIVRLPTGLRFGVLCECFSRLLQRHEILRTRYIERGGKVVQAIDAAAQLAVETRQVTGEAELMAALHEETQRPFELGRDLPIRVALFEQRDARWLSITMHHIATDGWSMRILIDELDELYGAIARSDAGSLAPLRVQYADYALWQRKWLQGAMLDDQLSYWRKQLAGLPQVHSVPLDRQRPARQRFRGACLLRSLEGESIRAVRSFGREYDVTPFMLMCSVFSILLNRYSGENDIAIGFPIAGRLHRDVEPLLGFFVNTLVIRNDLTDDVPFHVYLARCRQVVLDAYKHQHVPFEMLVEKLNPRRELRHNPLFQIMLSMHDRVDIDLQGERLQELTLPVVPAKQDLELSIVVGDAGMELRWIYDADLFQPATIERMAAVFETMLMRFIAAPTQRIHAVEAVSDAERAALLRRNDTREELREQRCVHELFEEQAHRSPHRTAVVCNGESFSYRALNESSNRLAHYLIGKGVQPDEPVGLCVRRSFDLLVGLLGILKAGGAYVPLDPDFPAARLEFMLRDAAARIVVAETTTLTCLPDGRHEALCLDDVTLRQSLMGCADSDPGCKTLHSRHLAYVLYTSGSTGNPKGVMVEHRSLHNLLAAMQSQLSLTADDRWLAVTTLSFDIAALELLLPLTVGAAVVLAEQGRTNDGEYLQALLGHGITAMQATPATWQLLVANGWRQSGPVRIICGGEALPQKLADELLSRSDAVWNVYGPTETTIWSTSQKMLLGGNAASIGRPLANTALYVLNQDLQLQPIGVPGELYIAGAGVARGYLNQAQLTRQRFLRDPFCPGGEERMYKTGDRVRWLADGTVEFLGRIDHQVKLRGFRIELGEIEHQLSKIEGVHSCVVLCREDEGQEKRLVAYVVPAQALEGQDEEVLGQQKLSLMTLYMQELKESLPHYMVPGVYVFMERLPLSPNGKVDRRSLPAPAAGDLQKQVYVAPRSEIETQLCAIWQEVLKLEQVGVHDDFFALGGHSLRAMQLISLVRERLALEVPLRSLFEQPTPAGLAGELPRLKQERVLAEIASSDRSGALPLSYAQQRLWMVDQIGQGGAQYNMPAAFRVVGELQIDALQAAIRRIVERHEVLRTRFVLQDDRVAQVVQARFELPWTYTDLSALQAREQEDRVATLVDVDALSRFDLSADALFRVHLLRLSPRVHVLLFNMHHIVSDGWSSGIVIRELNALYDAFVHGQPDPLPALQVQYGDFALWQRERLQGEVLRGQAEFWKEHLSGAPALLELPTDQPRPPMQSFRGESVPIVLDEELSAGLNALARGHDATLFMVLYTGLSILLSRLSGQDDLVIGVPVANRQRREVEALIGFFVNTLALRVRMEDNETVSQLLKRVKEVALAGYAHQEIPFEQVVEVIQPPRNLGHSAVFQAMLTVQNTPRENAEMNLAGLTFQPLRAGGGMEKFDLSFSFEGLGSRVVGSVNYASDLFQRSTIERWAGHLEKVLKGMVADGDRAASRVALLSEVERYRLIHEFNATQAGYPQDQLIHELFEAQVKRVPDAIAVVCEERQLSYRELNRRANQLAHYLRERGVGPDRLVGLCVERSVEMVVGLLGILKAGGAYVPLDPSYPVERLEYMLRDAAPQALLTQRHLHGMLSAGDTAAILLDGHWQEIEQSPHDDPGARKSGLTSQHLAYVIYTSGSTGRPKGVMVQHANLLNYMLWCREAFYREHDGGSPVLHSIAFDGVVTTLFGPLITGQALTLLPARQEMEWLSEAGKRGVCHALVKMTPSHLQLLNRMLDTNDAPCTRALMVGGEALIPRDISYWQRRYPGVRLINHFGPTEATVGCCTYEIIADVGSAASIPIGRPIANTQIYILDRHGAPVPIGVSGEIYIGGAGVAQGYLNRPELTAQRFVKDPFSADTQARMYRTGDLGRWRTDGTLEFLGRNDDQVKIRGYRIELGEIESQLSRHAAVKETVVVARQEGAVKQLVAYVTLHEGEAAQGRSEELRGHLRNALPEHMVPAAYVVLERLPLTSNGKVDRRSLPAPAAGDLQKQVYVAPRSEIETQLCAIWQEVLRVPEIGIEDNFFALGGDSIISIQVVSRAKRQGLQLSVKQLFEHQSIAALAPFVSGAQASSVSQEPSTGVLRLLPIQRAFFARALAQPNHFNQSVLLRTPPGFDAGALRAIVKALYERHDVLRLRCSVQGSQWEGSYRALDEQMLSQSVEVHDLGGVAPAGRPQRLEQLCEELQRSLDIQAGPLFKAAYFGHADEAGRLLLAIHHLAVDGVSWRILLSDLSVAWSQLSAGEPIRLQPKSTSYQSWAQQLHRYADSPQLLAEREYWLEQLAGAAPKVRRDAQAEALPGSSRRIELTQEQTSALLGECNSAYRTQVNELLLSALLWGYRAWSGQSRVRVAMEGHGREELFEAVDLSETVGWFTSHYPLLLQAQDDAPLGELIKQVKEQHRGLPRHGIGYGILRELSCDAQIIAAAQARPEAIVFNYLGQFDASVNERTGFVVAPESGGRSVGEDNAPQAPFTLNGIVHAGRLTLTLSCAAQCCSERELESFASHLQRSLLECIEHCRGAKPSYTPADFPFATASQQRLSNLQKTHPLLEDLYVATPMQAGLLFHGLLDGRGSSYTEQSCCDLAGRVDIESFNASWRQVVARHTALRTCFVDVGEDQIHQLVESEVELPLVQLDWQEKPRSELEDAFARLQQEDRARGFDFGAAPLMRLTLVRFEAERFRLIWSHHHVLLDGWCWPVVFAEVMTSYRAIASGQRPALPRVAPYASYIAWLRRQDSDKARAFWAEYLSGFDSPTSLPLPKPPQGGAEPGPRRKTLRLGKQLSDQLIAFARTMQCTMSTVVRAAWAMLLHRYSGENDVVFCAPVAGRPAELPGVERMIGLFMNTLPVRVRFHEHMRLDELLERLHRDGTAGDEHGYLGLAEIQSLSAVPNGAALSRTLLTIENYPTAIATQAADGALDFTVQGLAAQGQANYELTAIVHFDDEVTLDLDYRTDRVDAETVERVLSHMQELFTQLASAAPSQSIRSFELLGESERNKLLVAWNRTHRDYEQGLCIHELFERQVRLHAQKVAVIHGEQRLSYAQLNERSNRLARYLVEQGVRPDTLVGLSVERSVGMLVGLLGILKAGGAYVPLDPEYPLERLEYMLSDCGARIVLTESHLLSALPLQEQQVVLLDSEMQEALVGGYSPQDLDRRELGLHPNHLGYVIYTSGSTGQPKGVMVEHHTIVNFLNYSVEAFLPEHVAGSLVSAPLAFDGTVCPLYTPLLAGKYVELMAAADTAMDVLARHVFEQEDDLLFKLTPSHLEAMLGQEGVRRDEAARHVFVIAGELLTHKTLAPWRDELLPGSTFFNEYGPTETTVGTTVYHAARGREVLSGSGGVAIGEPLANARLYVLDEQLQLQPIGVPGELYIAGAGVARGYLNQAQLTRQRFLRDPFCPGGEERMYKTGDRVRWLADGTVEFLGRIDHQVKLRGFRIELGEIEHQLSKIEGVHSCVVLCREDEGQEKRLVAYVVPAQALEGQDEEVLGQQKLSLMTLYMQELKESLPHYMVPGVYVFMERLPLSPNGKVDRRSLPAPAAGDLQKQVYVAPRSEIETQLCAIWQEVLKLEQVGVHDDFFALGGHSLRAMQLISLVREHLALEVPLRSLFEQRSVAEFATVLDAKARADKLARNKARVMESPGTVLEGEIV